MTDSECVELLQWALPRLQFRWPGFRKVRRQVRKRIERRLQGLGLAGAEAYRDYLQSHPEEWQVLDTCCRITISRFYRDRGVFDYLGRVILPGLAQAAVHEGSSEVRCWSAGCASGEEPYTLAILAAHGSFAQSPGVRLRVLGTDVDEAVLARARRARYPPGSLKDVPADWLSGPLEPATKRTPHAPREGPEAAIDLTRSVRSTFCQAPLVRTGDEYEVQKEVRGQVEFQKQDIRRRMPEGPFDLVLCRNLVFTYFDEPLQRDVFARIIKRIRPGGVLVTGKQERLPEPSDRVSPIGRRRGVYRVSPA